VALVTICDTGSSTGTSCQNSPNINANPGITSISPNNGTQGASVPVTFSGSALTGTTSITAGSGITVSGITVVNDNSVTANFAIANNASTGSRTVTLTTPGGSASVSFTVNRFTGPATLTSISPTSGVRGATIPVTLLGNFFGTNPQISAGQNIGVNSVVVNSAGTQITARFTIGNTAATGPRNITVTNNSGTASAPVTFTVTAGTPGFTVPTNMMTTPATTATKTGTVTVANTATGTTAGPLTLTAAPMIRPQAGTGSWSITGGTCVSGLVLNPGDTCSVNIQFVPGGSSPLGTNVAIVTIADTGSSTGNGGQNSPNINAN
jgi:hypothetical protein